MKKALALIGTIIFVFSIVPMGAFADDDYVDHSSNIPPYVKGIIDLFSSTTYTLHFYDWEAWYNGSSVGTSTSSSAPIVYYDTLDIDFQFTGQPSSIVNTVVMFELYINNLYSIDYIELYSTSVHRNVSIFYYTYLHNSLYVICNSNTFYDATDFTLRIHFTEDHTVTTVTYSGLFGNVKIYHPENSANSYQYQLTEFYYLGAILRDLDSLNINLTDTLNFSDISQAISVLSSLLQDTYGKTYFNYSSLPSNRTIFATFDNSTLARSSYVTVAAGASASLRIDGNEFYIMISSYIDNHPNFVDLYVPLQLSNIPAGSKIIAEYYLDGNYRTAFNTSLYDPDNKDYCFVSFELLTTGQYLHFSFYMPEYFKGLTSGNGFYVHFTIEEDTNITPFIQFSADYTKYYSYAYYDNMLSNSKIQTILLSQILGALQNNSGGGSDSYPSYPSGPSDPQDPNQTTNIYDVNIEFNTQVGDISVFENTYSQQLPTYDQSISDQYLVPVSNSYDFSDLNSTFNSIWQSSFQYDTDEEDNIVGVYGIGLYFIIPLVLLVLFALFRRVTS